MHDIIGIGCVLDIASIYIHCISYLISPSLRFYQHGIRVHVHLVGETRHHSVELWVRHVVGVEVRSVEVRGVEVRGVEVRCCG